MMFNELYLNMATPKRPRDPNQLAKFITDIAVGDVENDRSRINGVNGHANKGQVTGGLKGGKARAEKLTAEQRKEIAQKAAKKRWGK
jgi:hypothetical protein